MLRRVDKVFSNRAARGEIGSDHSFYNAGRCWVREVRLQCNAVSPAEDPLK